MICGAPTARGRCGADLYWTSGFVGVGALRHIDRRLDTDQGGHDPHPIDEGDPS